MDSVADTLEQQSAPDYLRRAATAATVGNVLEIYDFIAFGIFAIPISVDRNFGEFNPADAVSMVLEAAVAALTRNGFNADLLNPLWALRDQRIMQAQRTVERYLHLGSIQNVLRENSELVGK